MKELYVILRYDAPEFDKEKDLIGPYHNEEDLNKYLLSLSLELWTKNSTGSKIVILEATRTKDTIHFESIREWHPNDWLNDCEH